jgi:hypothetical protein
MGSRARERGGVDKVDVDCSLVQPVAAGELVDELGGGSDNGQSGAHGEVGRGAREGEERSKREERRRNNGSKDRTDKKTARESETRRAMKRNGENRRNNENKQQPDHRVKSGKGTEQFLKEIPPKPETGSERRPLAPH